MLKVFEIRPADAKYEDRAWVVANTASEAKAVLSWHGRQRRTYLSDWEWVDQRVRRAPEMDYIVEQDKVTEPTFLFENETYEREMDILRRELW